ncbi:DUF3626 domain-containing protein [Sphaerisporangium sp. NPDC005288]|uniref:DUF3626 domain-containing protein n=1 Tax=Sphaerisporangium sp. NPDC005288 TaxID=3155114 RepID=UPI0033AAEB4A
MSPCRSKPQVYSGCDDGSRSGRLRTGGRQIMCELAGDGVYLSQFVTGTSNGGRTAHPGGDRWRWESRIFGGAYDHAPAEERPVYGARRLPCRVGWHSGFRLTVEHLRRHPGYRGQEYVALGAEIAVDGLLDPRIIGAAAGTGRYDSQGLKKVRHCVARFGSSLAGEK